MQGGLLHNALNWLGRFLLQPMTVEWVARGAFPHTQAAISDADQELGQRLRMGDGDHFAYRLPWVFLRDYQGLPPGLGWLHRAEHRLYERNPESPVRYFFTSWLQGHPDTHNLLVLDLRRRLEGAGLALPDMPEMVTRERGDIQAIRFDVAYHPRLPHLPAAGPSEPSREPSSAQATTPEPRAPRESDAALGTH